MQFLLFGRETNTLLKKYKRINTIEMRECRTICLASRVKQTMRFGNEPGIALGLSCLDFDTVQIENNQIGEGFLINEHVLMF